MKLPQAIRKSSIRCAYLPRNDKNWSHVIVEWERHVYTAETHVYTNDGNLFYQIICYNRMNEQQLLQAAGPEIYYSNEWEPYENDYHSEIAHINTAVIPPKTKTIIRPIVDDEWRAMFE